MSVHVKCARQDCPLDSSSCNWRRVSVRGLLFPTNYFLVSSPTCPLVVDCRQCAHYGYRACYGNAQRCVLFLCFWFALRTVFPMPMVTFFPVVYDIYFILCRVRALSGPQAQGIVPPLSCLAEELGACPHGWSSHAYNRGHGVHSILGGFWGGGGGKFPMCHPI